MKIVTKTKLEEERDTCIFAIHSAMEAEDMHQVKYLVGRLIQLQDLILSAEDLIEEVKPQQNKPQRRTKTDHLTKGEM